MGWVVNATPRPLYLQERHGTHCTGGWVGPGDSLDGCGKSRPPPGFDPRTVQPVASRYTDYAIPAHLIYSNLNFLEKFWKNTVYQIYNIFSTNFGKILYIKYTIFSRKFLKKCCISNIHNFFSRKFGKILYIKYTVFFQHFSRKFKQQKSDKSDWHSST
jgi:hypothetical protein